MSGSARRKPSSVARNDRSSCSTSGAGDAGSDTSAPGHAVTVPPRPSGTNAPASVVNAIPSTIAPGTRRATSAAVSARPARQSAVGPLAKSPCVTNVAGLATTTPPLRSPMKAMKRPMPPVIASVSE